MEELEKELNYNFKNKEILRTALIHKSYNEGLQKNLPDNEKLEFLGDSVINLVITEYLYKTFKNWSEGELSKLKSHLVSSNYLCGLTLELGLNEYILLGKGEEKNKGRNNKKINASLFEAVIGAIYLDSNYKVTSSVVIPFFKTALDKFTEKDKDIRINDFKSELQEVIQEKNNYLPVYKIIDESGKPPDEIFTAAVYLDNIEIGRGKGKNKRHAEQSAAANALEKMGTRKKYEKLSEVFFYTRPNG